MPSSGHWPAEGVNSSRRVSYDDQLRSKRVFHRIFFYNYICVPVARGDSICDYDFAATRGYCVACDSQRVNLCCFAQVGPQVIAFTRQTCRPDASPFRDAGHEINGVSSAPSGGSARPRTGGRVVESRDSTWCNTAAGSNPFLNGRKSYKRKANSLMAPRVRDIRGLSLEVKAGRLYIIKVRA